MARVNDILDNFKDVSANGANKRPIASIMPSAGRLIASTTRPIVMRSQVRAKTSPRRRVGAWHARCDRGAAGGERGRHRNGAARVESRAVVRRNEAELGNLELERRGHG